MIDVVTKDNAHLYTEALDEMFRLRHDVYVKERGWSDLARPDGLERDQFDNENATYLIAFDDGRVSGSVRLLPTTAPHLLGDLFPQLCEAAPVPRADDIMEITRLCAHADYRQPGKKSVVIDRLATGMFEHAMNLGLRSFSMVTDAWIISRALQFGWKLKPLGLPQPYKEGTCIAGLVTVDQDSLDNFYRTRNLVGPILNYVGIPRPSVELPGEHRAVMPARVH